ncbi:hypothetical protein FSO04_43900 [Paraburkholderia madseniana]|uniref:Uncharacterized protein n=1 Tax=Paraburkholderia madseniana TaxID=2599607 RepID=A0A6N6VZM7_9BURK|nr:hypothetical protein [Paraburkholderia madseniana]KAE8753656.1 hypothetical protein FSO04_43900 [Paraburkholderia madseniana]
MPPRADLAGQARREAVEVSLLNLLNNYDAETAVLSDAVPNWLREELACEGVQIYQERHGTWILAPLSQTDGINQHTTCARTI